MAAINYMYSRHSWKPFPHVHYDIDYGPAMVSHPAMVCCRVTDMRGRERGRGFYMVKYDYDTNSIGNRTVTQNNKLK